jgi:hypothetical protein
VPGVQVVEGTDPAREPSASPARSAGAAEVLDPAPGEVSLAHAAPVDRASLRFRMTLRQVLFTGMEDVVHFDKSFTKYQEHSDGTVTAHFADGTSVTGDVLVAADGANSAVRQQYLPHATVTDTRGSSRSAGGRLQMKKIDIATIERAYRGV